MRENQDRARPVLEPADITDACDNIVGRLRDLLAQAEAQLPPAVGAEAMHPIVWGASKKLLEDGYYRLAVRAAAEAVVQVVKTMTGRNDAPESSLWQDVFSDKAPTPGHPQLRWPGDPSDQTVKSMNDGLQRFAPGVQMTIRNPLTHVVDELDQQAALERLSTLSLLARWVDECQLIRHTEQMASAPIPS